MAPPLYFSHAKTHNAIRIILSRAGGNHSIAIEVLAISKNLWGLDPEASTEDPPSILLATA
jgi:hypothetical protein